MVCLLILGIVFGSLLSCVFATKNNRLEFIASQIILSLALITCLGIYLIQAAAFRKDQEQIEMAVFSHGFPGNDVILSQQSQVLASGNQSREEP